jgi:cyanophycinase-like exopeptidase
LALIGGGEFTFGETESADAAWLAKAPPGPVGFVPTASGSVDYGVHFTSYLGEYFEREVEVIPIYRGRDARRTRNLDRLRSAAAVYLGGGVADTFLDTWAGSPAAEALEERLSEGGLVVAIAAAAQALGQAARSLTGGEMLAGLGWLDGAAVETNFSTAHDRRARSLAAVSGVDRVVGLPPGSALLLGPEGAREVVGTIFQLEDPEGEWQVEWPAKQGDTEI